MTGAPSVAPEVRSPFDVVPVGPDTRTVTPTSDTGAPPPSWTDLFHAARPEALRSTPLYDETKIGMGYAPIIDALGLPASENPGYFGSLDSQGEARFGSVGSPSRLATAARQGEQVPFSSQYLADRTIQEGLIVAQIKARRAKEPGFLPGVPDTVDGLHTYFEQQQAAKRAAGAAVLARGSTLGRVTASLAAGGVESAVNDPTFLPTMVLGGGTASSLLQAIARDALINGALAIGQLPQLASNMAENDEHLTAGDIVGQVAGAAALGAVAGGTIHLTATHVPPALFKVMPEAVQRRWAGRMRVGENGPLLKDVLTDMDNRELSSFARSTIGTRMTPDEKAAANVLERSHELGEASPFEPGPVGDAAHNASLAASLKSIIDGAHSSGAPIHANRGALLASSSPVGLRPPAPVDVPIDAGFETQWRAIVGNEGGTGARGEFLVSPKGAVGPAQVMPGTAPYAAKLAGLPWDDARYHSDVAYNQALGRAYYAEQLKTFGDPAMAAAAYNAGPGSAARGTGLRGALKRAAEHGEPGNWEAYLPRETQRYVEDFRRRAGGAAGEPAIAVAGGDDEIAALNRSADEAEAEALELSRDRATAEPVSLLKRELFTDDEQWADAQAAFHQSLNAPEEPAGAPLSSETGSGPPEVAAEPTAGPVVGPGATDTVEDRAARVAVQQQPGETDAAFLTRLESVEVAGRELMAQRASAPFSAAAHSPAGPLTMAELEAIGRPANAKIDPLWYAGLNAVRERELGREPKALWALRNKHTEEIVSWGVKRAQVEAEKAKFWEPDQLDLELLHPNNVAVELRDRAVEEAARAAAADVRIDEPELKAFDEPGGAGAKDQAASLEHDARMEVSAPRTYQLTEDGPARTLAELLEEIDRDKAAAAALRSCAEGGGE